MRNKITMEMSICQAENGFSLDELAKKNGSSTVCDRTLQKNRKIERRN